MSSLLPLSPIMLVDEDADDALLLCRCIGSTGSKHPLLTFGDGAGAIRYLEKALASPAREGLPCLLFTDLKLPGTDGFEIVAWTRRQRALDAMMIVVVSGSEDPSHAKRAVDLGADRYLLKIPPTEVVQATIAEAQSFVHRRFE